MIVGNKNPIFIEYLLSHCLGYFSHCFDKLPDKKNQLKGKTFPLAYSARQLLQSTMVRNHLKDTTVSIPSAARKQSEQEETPSYETSSLSLVSSNNIPTAAINASIWIGISVQTHKFMTDLSHLNHNPQALLQQHRVEPLLLSFFSKENGELHRRRCHLQHSSRDFLN